MKINTLLGNDLVINENDCNLSCQYCLTGQSNLKQNHKEQLIFKTPKRDNYGENSSLKNYVDKTEEKISHQFKMPFIKITGGEVFLIKNMMNFIKKCSDKYHIVIVQTNGLLLKDEHIEQLEALKNIVVQVSLDSHTFQGNSYRISKESLHDKAIKKITRLLDSKLPTEIYCVLNDRSVVSLKEFIYWIHNKQFKTVLFPFPVRGPDSFNFRVTADQLHYIEHINDYYDECQSVLPPRAYFTRLNRFYRDNGRMFRCHLPRLVISSFSDGVVTACPNIWFSQLGNAVTDDEEAWHNTVSKVGTNGLYKALLADKPRLNACKSCLTPWDTLSMYFDDEITLDELCESPTYNHPRIKEMILQKKIEYSNGACLIDETVESQCGR